MSKIFNKWKSCMEIVIKMFGSLDHIQSHTFSLNTLPNPSSFTFLICIILLPLSRDLSKKVTHQAKTAYFCKNFSIIFIAYSICIW